MDDVAENKADENINDLSILEIADDHCRTRAKEILKAAITPHEPFDLSCLPKPISQYVDSICSITDADSIMVTSSVLCMISAFVKKSCFIPEFDPTSGTDGYFQRLYSNLWCLNISRSGMFKTTALNKGFKIAFNKESEIGERATPLDDACADSVLLPTRVTVEGLLEHLSKGYAGAIVCSEFGAWLGSLERTYNQGLKALFTDLYDVPKHYSYKTRSSGNLIVKEPFITICGMSTFEWVKKSVKPDDVSSGFFARFLIFNPPQKDLIPSALPQIRKLNDKDSGQKIIEVLKNLPEERAYELDIEAKEIFSAFHGELYATFQIELPVKSQELLQPYLKRWSPYVLKIALLLQLFIDSQSSKIGSEALQGAILIVKYSVRSTIWLFQNELGESGHQKKCRKVLEYVAKKGGQVLRRELIQSKVLTGGTKEYDYVLTTLEESGEIKIIGGRNRKQNLKICLVSRED